MTIGTGYFSNPRIVLGSDMEMTGVAKYKAVKDHFKWFDKEDGVIVSVYSGLEDDVRNVWERLTERIEQKDKENDQLGVRGAREILEDSLRIVKGKSFQMLVAITKRGEPPCYLRVFYRTTSPAKSWEIIGGGDVELARYLVGLMDYESLTIDQAVLWSVYIINSAISFVPGVGQGICLTVVEDGRVHYFNGDIFLEKLSTFESYIAGLWFDFRNLTLPKDEFRQRLEAFAAAAIALRGKMPQIFKKLAG